MVWLTWKQHSIEVLLGIAIILCVSLLLIVTGVHIYDAYQQYITSPCHLQPVDCIRRKGLFSDYINDGAFGNHTGEIAFFLTILFLPLVPGVFLGTLVVAREIEQGTYRMIWTQGISWSRWMLLKLAVLGGGTLLLVGLLQLLLSWWVQPMQSADVTSMWQFFDMRGIVPLAYTAFTFAFGVAAGTLLRRTVPAIALTVVVFVALRLLIFFFWRPYFLPPQSLLYTFDSGYSLPANTWILSQDITDRSGNVAPTIYGMPRVCFSTPDAPKLDESPDLFTCMKTHALRNRMLYQPVERFWLFQGIETTVYLGLGALCVGATFWWVKHKIL